MPQITSFGLLGSGLRLSNTVGKPEWYGTIKIGKQRDGLSSTFGLLLLVRPQLNTPNLDENLDSVHKSIFRILLASVKERVNITKAKIW